MGWSGLVPSWMIQGQRYMLFIFCPNSEFSSRASELFRMNRSEIWSTTMLQSNTKCRGYLQADLLSYLLPCHFSFMRFMTCLSTHLQSGETASVSNTGQVTKWNNTCTLVWASVNQSKNSIKIWLICKRKICILCTSWAFSGPTKTDFSQEPISGQGYKAARAELCLVCPACWK